MKKFTFQKLDIYHSLSFEDLEKAETQPESDLSVINKRLETLSENHWKDLERLYTIQARDYKADVKNQYFSFDESELENPATESSAIEVNPHDDELSFPNACSVSRRYARTALSGSSP